MPTPISTPSAPTAVGPYSQAVQSGNLLFCSGQIAIDPATQKLIDGSVAEEVHQVLKNLTAVLVAAGSDLGKVVKTTVLLANIADYATMNEVYGEYFSTHKPARAAFAVAALPAGAKVEIDAIAEI